MKIFKNLFEGFSKRHRTINPRKTGETFHEKGFTSEIKMCTLFKSKTLHETSRQRVKNNYRKICICLIK